MNDNGKPQAPGCEIRWAAISGRWKFEHSSATYLEGLKLGEVERQPLAMGLALTNQKLQDGKVDVNIRFKALGSERHGAGLVLGYRSEEKRYIMVQLAASDAAYSLSEFRPNTGWFPIFRAGSASNLESNRVYSMRAKLSGQQIAMSVDGVDIFHEVLQQPLGGSQVGVIAAGCSEINFTDLVVQPVRSTAFIAMQFGEPFDTIYDEVIEPTVDHFKVKPDRMDNVAGPGVIVEDMKRRIAASTLVVAEITARNPNVFYEIGYAHALHKPTILLAQRAASAGAQQLPFDIQGYRVVFYDDSIGGKSALEKKLNSFLRATLEDFDD